MPCPECGHELRDVKSISISLCDNCGWRSPLAPPAPPLKKKKVNFLPLIFLIGFGGLAIALMGGTTAHRMLKEREIAKLIAEAEAKIESTEALIKELRGADLSTLPEICKARPGYQLMINQPVFRECFPDGITYPQVNKMMGTPGEVVSSSGSTKMVQFMTYNGGGTDDPGYMSLVFHENRLVSKSQFNLSSTTTWP